jgi:hypothetical protein
MGIRRRMSSRVAFAITAFACVTAGAANAQSSGAVFAGAETGRDWSAYAGAVWAPETLGDARWAVRGVVSTGGYDYRSSGNEIDATYGQAEAVVLRQMSGAWGYLNLGGGARFTDTNLDPDDPGNARRGGRWDVLIAADGVRRMQAWELGGFATYGVDMEEYFVRGRVTRAVGSGGFRLGVEAVAQGDPNYDRQGIALVAAHRQASGLEWTATAGVRGGEAHVSIGLVRAF